ncbi:MAG: hypothetical protein IKW93_00835 [Bacteroidales bacterium]|nr:hypothetical protein [Bacteroidales bacterium]
MILIFNRVTKSGVSEMTPKVVFFLRFGMRIRCHQSIGDAMTKSGKYLALSIGKAEAY